jgi:hypothetical protein
MSMGKYSYGHTIKHKNFSTKWVLRDFRILTRRNDLESTFLLADLVCSCKDRSRRDCLGIRKEERIARHQPLPWCCFWPTLAAHGAEYYQQGPCVHHKRFTSESTLFSTTIFWDTLNNLFSHYIARIITMGYLLGHEVVC